MEQLFKAVGKKHLTPRKFVHCGKDVTEYVFPDWDGKGDKKLVWDSGMPDPLVHAEGHDIPTMRLAVRREFESLYGV